MTDPKILQVYIDEVIKVKGEQNSPEIIVKNINEIFEVHVAESEINAYFCIDKDLEINLNNLNINY